MIEGAELSAGGKAEVKSKLFFMTLLYKRPSPLLLLKMIVVIITAIISPQNVNIATKCLSPLVMPLCLTTSLLNINMTLCLSSHQTNTRRA